MNKQFKAVPISKLKNFHSSNFGEYDPSAMGISINQLKKMNNAAEADLEKIEKKYIPRNLRKQGITLFSRTFEGDRGFSIFDSLRGMIELNIDQYQKLQEITDNHFKKFNFLYRVRIHEINHWYLHLSSTLPIARLFANRDCQEWLWGEIRKLANSDKPIYMPLKDWSPERQECPENLAKAIDMYHWNRISDFAVDGGPLLDDHFFQNQHIFTRLFPELQSVRQFWELPDYKIGYRALVEGAAKAAEWLFFLRKDKSWEKQAYDDILHSEPIYRAAFEHLSDAIKLETLREYLQLLSVMVEFSINPYISEKMWPFLWTETPGEIRAADVLPGFRFQMLLRLLDDSPKLDYASKEAVAEYFTVKTNTMYGWPSPFEAIKSIDKFLKKAKNKAPNRFSNFKIWDPLETIKSAVEIKLKDNLAFVEPMNLNLINRDSTFTPPMITSPGFFSGETSHVVTYVSAKTQQNILNILVYDILPTCPFRQNEWYSWIYENSEYCKISTQECIETKEYTDDMIIKERIGQLQSKLNQLRNCQFYNGFISTQFGADWFDRMRYPIG